MRLSLFACAGPLRSVLGPMGNHPLWRRYSSRYPSRRSTFPGLDGPSELSADRDFPTKRTVASVSGNSVIVRYVKMAKTSPPNWPSPSIRSGTVHPFNIEEVNLSFSIIGEAEENGQPQIETVLVAAKKESVDLRVELLRESGLQPVILDVDAFALENAYESVYRRPDRYGPFHEYRSQLHQHVHH